MKTLKECVKYVYNYIKDYDPENCELLAEDDIYDMMEEMLLENLEWVLSEKDMEERVSSKDEEYLDKVLNERLWEKYSILLQAMANDVLNEYVLSDNDDNEDID